jgi:hypothetical protein
MLHSLATVPLKGTSTDSAKAAPLPKMLAATAARKILRFMIYLLRIEKFNVTDLTGFKNLSGHRPLSHDKSLLKG